MDFSRWRNLIIDMDGVLWEGQTPLPGLLPFFAALRSTRRAFVLATNNAGLTIDQYVARLGKHGVEVSSAEVMNSAEATADWLMARAPGARLNVIGGLGLLDALTRRGFHIVDSGVDFVVVGKDYGLTWQKLDAAVLEIGTGAQLVGTNPDVTYPIENGLGIGNGAILAALTAATGVSPIIIGKPEPIMYQQALARMQCTAASTLAVGDRLDTDILGAQRAGIASVLLLTGIATAAQLAASDLQPDAVLPGLPALTAALLAAPG